MQYRLTPFLCLALALSCSKITSKSGISPNSAACFSQECAAKKLVALSASNVSAGDNLGKSVSVSGDVAAVGSPYDDTRGTDSGAVYVFREGADGWSFQQKIIAPDYGDKFGWTVSVRENLIAVGGASSRTMYVYQFDGTNWNRIAGLVPTGFGNTVLGLTPALTADRLVVGAPGEGSAATGAAVVYDRSGTTFTQKTILRASTPYNGSDFGRTVVMSGDTIVVGAPLETDAYGGIGALYVFHYDGTTWTEVQKIKMSGLGRLAANKLGCSLSMAGDYLAAGDCLDDDKARSAGAVYVFKYTNGTWNQLQKIVADDYQMAEFGNSIALTSKSLYIASKYGDSQRPSAGSVFRYDFDGTQWAKMGKIVNTSDTLGYFARAIAASESFLLIGSYGADDFGTDAGACHAMPTR